MEGACVWFAQGRRWGNHNADYFTLPPRYRPKGLVPSLAKSPTL